MNKRRRWAAVVLSTAAAAVVLFGSVAIGDSTPDSDATRTAAGPVSQETPSIELREVAPVTAAGPAKDSAPDQAVVTAASSIDTSEASGPLQPLRVRIPGIEVDAPITDLGVNPDGTLEVPSDFDDTGWYTGRSIPGEIGPSVVVGHVDSQQGPAVFYRLRDLVIGDTIQVDRTDGLVAWFEVTETVLVDKDVFPTEDVYGGTDIPELRLITCGGSFDRNELSYRGNLIVFASHIGNYEPGIKDGIPRSR